MSGFGVSLPELSQAYPALLYSGSTDLGNTFTSAIPSNSGHVRLVLGIDAYPNVQPNNGNFQVTLQTAVSGSSVYVAYRAQQSQNFPGPFHWRGLAPIPDSYRLITVSSTVPFDFAIWGLIVVDWTWDLVLGQ